MPTRAFLQALHHSGERFSSKENRFPERRFPIHPNETKGAHFVHFVMPIISQSGSSLPADTSEPWNPL